MIIFHHYFLFIFAALFTLSRRRGVRMLSLRENAPAQNARMLRGVACCKWQC